jgi:hypothetical protein
MSVAAPDSVTLSIQIPVGSTITIHHARGKTEDVDAPLAAAEEDHEEDADMEDPALAALAQNLPPPQAPIPSGHQGVYPVLPKALKLHFGDNGYIYLPKGRSTFIRAVCKRHHGCSLQKSTKSAMTRDLRIRGRPLGQLMAFLHGGRSSTDMRGHRQMRYELPVRQQCRLFLKRKDGAAPFFAAEAAMDDLNIHEEPYLTR